MDKETFDYVAERCDVLSTTDASTQSTKDAANAWKAAVATDSSDAAVEVATATLLDYLDGRPRTIDDLIAFAQGPAKEIMGEEGAAQFLAVQEERKAQGAKFCDCPACTASSEILAKFGRAKL